MATALCSCVANQLVSFGAWAANTTFTMFSFAAQAIGAIVACGVELGGYAVAALSFFYTLFIACCVPALSEFLRPASEWHGSEVSKANVFVQCISCMLVVLCILLITIVCAFVFTANWYEVELLAGNEDLQNQLLSTEA